MFRRRTTAEPAVQDPELTPPRQDGKGRPTPKRKEAQRGRQPIGAPPRDRKEAARKQRAQTREQRAKARAAMDRGEAVLPRDKGPVRTFARDYIDTRRCAAEYFLLGAVVIFVMGFVPALALYAVLAFYGFILVIVADSVIITRGLKREARRRFPDESTKGVSSYAVIRSLQFRGLRMPKPRVRRGAEI